MPLFTGCLDTCLPDSPSQPDCNFKEPHIILSAFQFSGSLCCLLSAPFILLCTQDYPDQTHLCKCPELCLPPITSPAVLLTLRHGTQMLAGWLEEGWETKSLPHERHQAQLSAATIPQEMHVSTCSPTASSPTAPPSRTGSPEPGRVLPALTAALTS